MKTTTRMASRIVAALVLAIMVSACDGLLTVSDPQRYTSPDLDDALPAVANGVEGGVHELIDGWVTNQALLADVYQHTGTWSGYDDIDHGRVDYTRNSMGGYQSAWNRVRWFALAAEERFKRVLGDAEASSSPLLAQAQLGGALASLWDGMTFCESVTDADPADQETDPQGITDMQMLAEAEAKLTATMATAQAAGRPDYANAAQAGRAVARMLQDNLAGAASDAAAIPAGFSYDAVFNAQSTNSVVLLTTKNFNEAAGLMHKWWPMIAKSDDPGYMTDPVSGMPDMRLPVYFDGEIATDNETPHYSQWKYNTREADIPMLHSDGMRLIIAEAMARSGDVAGALGVVNELRAAVGLPGHDMPSSVDEALQILLWERFAEHFMEGQRMVDLHRFGLVRQVFTALNDDERIPAGRATKWPMSSGEALYNDNLDDDVSKRCAPTT